MQNVVKSISNFGNWLLQINIALAVKNRGYFDEANDYINID